ncbi:MAG: hypothetical protein ACRC6R_02945 [Bacteroidales bacterium]
MKMKNYIVAMFIATAILPSCSVNDQLGELTQVGQVAPHVQWDLSSSTVKAGNPVAFAAQYYSSVNRAIIRSEVWYNVVENIQTTIACPWMSTFTYSFVNATSEELRISQKIASYNHDLAQWDGDKKAYQLNTTFPTSNTLRPISWTEVESFDLDKFNLYFGEDYKQEFIDGLIEQMKLEDYRNLLVGTSAMGEGVEDHAAEFAKYTEGIYSDNTGGTIFIWKDGGGDQYNEGSIPQDIVDAFNSISFEDFLYDSVTQKYRVSYERDYTLDVILKVIDEAGTEGTTKAVKNIVTLN